VVEVAEKAPALPSVGFGIPTLESLPDPAGRRVLVRADLDIPPDAQDQPQRSSQLRRLGPTLSWLANRGAIVTVCGHQGKLGHAAAGRAFERTVLALKELYPGIEVASNLAAEDGQSANPGLLRRLVEGQELFVNDDFRWSSVALTSIIGPAGLLPSAAGRQLEKDVALLSTLLVQPERPFVVLLGSRQTLDRLPNLYALMLRADAVLVGGQMSVPFLQALGKQPHAGADQGFIDECRHAYGVGEEIGHRVVLPMDLVWERAGGGTESAPQDVASDGCIVDIGPEAAREFGEVVRGARSVLWGGSLGKVEDPLFAEGTLSVARALASSPARTVLGGDALLGLLRTQNLVPSSASSVSATGSAIAYMKDGDLVGLAALRTNGMSRCGDIETPSHGSGEAFTQPNAPEASESLVTRPRAAAADAGTSRIVVGVDGSPLSVEALQWAVTQAQLTASVLEVVMAWEWPPAIAWSVPLPDDWDPEAEAQRSLESIVGSARLANPDLKMDVRLAEGNPTPVLVEASDGADLLVVGSRGSGGFKGMLLGSVGEHCAAKARCPVLVYRPAQPTPS